MPSTVADDYQCFGVEVDEPGRRQITAIAPKIDNAKIVHHVLLFRSPTPFNATHQRCEAFGGLNWQFLYGWAPGGEALTLPDDVGFPLEPGQHYVVQVHYSNLGALEGERDGTGFEACTTDTPRTHEADVVALGGARFTIPPRASLDLTCDLNLTLLTPLNVIATFPHMHKLGTSIATTKLATSTEPAVDLGSHAVWDFNNQPWTARQATLRSGDTVRVQCGWQNPTDAAVTFGEATNQEMCFTFTMYYPRIVGVPAWSWLTPSYLSRCTSTSR
jgi:hypothetical protein